MWGLEPCYFTGVSNCKEQKEAMPQVLEPCYFIEISNKKRVFFYQVFYVVGNERYYDT